MTPSRVAASVRVPATSANLGPGFDCLGLALDLYDDVAAEVVASGLQIATTGEGAGQLPRDETHLVVRAMRATFDVLGAQPPGLALRGTNRIPHGRGLGSSAAAICAGVLLARALSDDGPRRLDDAAVLALAARIEGHPDNVAPCLFGGLTVAWTDEAGAAATAVRLETVPSLRPVLLVAPFVSSTAQARALLPDVVPFADAAFTAGRCAALVAALTAHPAVLFAATRDRLHQDRRAPAMPATAQLVARLRAEGLPAVVSGAGPTVLVLATSAAEVDRAVAVSPPQWRPVPAGVDRGGARVTGEA